MHSTNRKMRLRDKTVSRLQQADAKEIVDRVRKKKPSPTSREVNQEVRENLHHYRFRRANRRI